MPFADVGSLSLWMMGRASRASRASTRHDDVSRPVASKCEPRARTAHTLRIAGRGWHISGLASVATSTAVLGALVSLGCEETLSTSAVSCPSVWPAWTVYSCSLCPSPVRGGWLVYAQLPQHARRMLIPWIPGTASKQRRMASCAACGRPIRPYVRIVITAAAVCVPMDARNRHAILHNAQCSCASCISAGRSPVVDSLASRSLAQLARRRLLCTPGPTAQ